MVKHEAPPYGTAVFCNHVANQAGCDSAPILLPVSRPRPTPCLKTRLHWSPIAIWSGCMCFRFHRARHTAARMPQINGATVKARAAHCARQVTANAAHGWTGRLANPVRLVEQSTWRKANALPWQGQQSFARIDWPEADAPHAQGQIVDVTITGMTPGLAGAF